MQRCNFFFILALRVVIGCDIEVLLSSPAGYRSIVSSHRFPQTSDLENEIVSIVIPSHTPAPINEWQLKSFLVPYHKSSAAFLFSISSVFPVSASPSCFIQQPTVLLEADGNDIKAPAITKDLVRDLYSNPHTVSFPYATVTTKNIQIGEELTRQNFLATIREATKFMTNDPSKAQNLQRYCLTDIQIGLSKIPKAGKGVFAKKSFREGDIITVSPMFVLPRHEVEMTIESSLLMNYCFISNRSDVALLPATQIALMNHGGKYHSNVRMRWAPPLPVEAEPQQELLSWLPKRLELELNPPLDLFFIADKNIAAGEELLIDYGEQWERRWREYLTELQQWIEIYASSGLEILHKPQFRSFISGPEELFPSHWQGQCIGTTPCVSDEETEAAKLEYDQLIEDALRFHSQISVSQEAVVDPLS